MHFLRNKIQTQIFLMLLQKEKKLKKKAQIFFEMEFRPSMGHLELI
jgi:hypothetical protein